MIQLEDDVTPVRSIFSGEIMRQFMWRFYITHQLFQEGLENENYEDIKFMMMIQAKELIEEITETKMTE